MIVPFTLLLMGWGMLRTMRLRSLALLCLTAIALPLPARPPSAGSPAGNDAPPAAATMRQRDHERVREAVARGEMVPLETILADALKRHPGRLLEVELEGGEYEVEILGADGVVRELEYDARSGELLEIEVED